MSVGHLPWHCSHGGSDSESSSFGYCVAVQPECHRGNGTALSQQAAWHARPSCSLSTWIRRPRRHATGTAAVLLGSGAARLGGATHWQCSAGESLSDCQ